MDHTVKELRRDRVMAVDGEAGRIEDVYFDNERWDVRYLVVHAGGWLTARRVLIPPTAIDADGAPGRQLRVRLTRDEVQHAPDADTNRPVSRQLELEHALQLGYPYCWSGLLLWADEATAWRQLGKRDAHLLSGVDLLGYRIEGPDGLVGKVVDFVIDERWTVRSLLARLGSKWAHGEVRIEPGDVSHIDCDAGKVQLRSPRALGAAVA
jgi:hypothetical protein